MRRPRWSQVRRFLPVVGVPLYAGLKSPYDVRLGEATLGRLVPWLVKHDLPQYEQALISGLNSYVEPGDTVVVVGVGAGITATVAAMRTGPSGRVVCFEGNREAIPLIKKTFARNKVTDRIELVEAIVGTAVHVYGNTEAQTIVPPTKLPACDVLELDCEGSEIGILQEMTSTPRIVLVETHGFRGAPSVEVRSVLESRGYHVDNLGVAEPALEKTCLELDIVVLAGQLRL